MSPRGLPHHGRHLRAGPRRLRSRHRVARARARMRIRRSPLRLSQSAEFCRENRCETRKSPPRRATGHSRESENLSLCRDFRERLKGLEPSTFCMASVAKPRRLRRIARRRRPCMTGALPATPGFDTVVSVWFLSRSRRLDLASWFAPREMRTCGCDAIAFTRKECCGGDAVALSQREAAPMQPRRLEKKRNTGETGDRGTTGVPSGRPGNRGPPVAHRSARPLMTADQREGRASDPHDAPR